MHSDGKERCILLLCFLATVICCANVIVLIIPNLGIIIPIMGTNSISLSDALFTRVQQRVLGLLFVHSERSYYTNEIVNCVDLGTGVVQRELEKLTASGLLVMSKKGNQKHYQANQSNPVFSELKSIVLKTVGLGDVIRLALQPLASKIQVAFVYGSIAKGEETATSDIDLFVITNDLDYADLFAAITPVEEQLARPVNPTVYSRDEFKKKLKSGNSFVTRVLSQPKILLMGTEDDLK